MDRQEMLALRAPDAGAGAPAFPIRAAGKRGMDLAISTLALIVSTPLWLLVAVAIRLSSSGPVLYRQTRIGRGGEAFPMLKFRTMYDGAHELRSTLEPQDEPAEMFKLRNDPRVTRIGYLLRRSSLDELPQLINVLRGEMSLVGPRPLIVEEDSRIQGPYRRRLLMRPGITGPWQALGPVRPSLREMVVMDCLYVEQWSLRDDFKILWRTLVHMACLRGL
jgi:lipopolysaccharide/colanic/teichoic acid biosynthesis glycosyltransferase